MTEQPYVQRIQEVVMDDKRDPFFSVPIKKFQATLGAVDLPIFYYDYGYAHFFFWADCDKLLPKLAETAFAPCVFFNGKGGVLLNFFEYRNTAIGPYYEVGLSILCYPRKMKTPGLLIPQLFKDAKEWTMGAYVINLPVTTEIAYLAGKEIWGYPKFVTQIAIDLKGRQFSGSVDDPVLKAPIFTLNGTIGVLAPSVSMPKASFISHSTHQARGLRTLTEVDANAKIALGFSGRLSVSDQSTHGMAANLRDIGLKDKKPFFVMYCEKARMILNEGVPIE
jgi:hypothetical protein